MAASSSSSVRSPPHNQVFINFRGELRQNFVSHLKKELETDGINVFIDENSTRGENISTLFNRIEESKIALAILSAHYAESHWCLDELEKIKECVDLGKLVVIPIFYKVEVADVKNLKGVFGEEFWKLIRKHEGKKMDKWKEALGMVSRTFGVVVVTRERKESDAVTEIVKHVKEALTITTGREREIPIDNPGVGDEDTAESASDSALPSFGIETRLKQLEEMLNSHSDRTLKLGLVGMPGIGKTTLTNMLYEERKGKFFRHALLQDVRDRSKNCKMDGIILPKDLLRNEFADEVVECMPAESLKTHLLRNKSLVVLDNVTKKKQLEVLLGNGDWIKEGSLIIITTSDRSVIEGEVDNIYEVLRLSGRDSLQCFSHYAFGVVNPVADLMNLSKEFSEYAKGNPLALKILGAELNGKNKAHWEEKLQQLAQNPNKTIQDFLQISYNALSRPQKDVFLDVACFFRSGDEYYVRCLVESCDTDPIAGVSDEIKDLASKFLINISGGRVEMHDLLYTFGKELASQRLCRLLLNHKELDALKKTAGDDMVRGIFIDMSEMEKELSLDKSTFEKMRNLRYLKLYSSHCHRQCKPDCKLNFPDGLELPLDEIRYLYWLKFPFKKLPKDFDPKNLIDLNLPYSKIQGVWDGVKKTPKLKWVDLSYSSQLSNLSGLLNAESLQRLNLEGCTSLKELPKGMKRMQSLVFLNMRGCTSLRDLPNINLTSMKTLILTNCSSLQTFKVISNNLENLYLDGTAIGQLPKTMWKLQRLIVLNLKDCEKLEAVPECLGKLKALQELVLSGCSKLETFPVPIEKMKSLQILLLDGTGISTLKVEDIPELRRSMNGISSLQRLCLSRNHMINLQDNIRLLCHLKLLDLKFCKNLTSIPQLPPNLEILDAHGCEKLKTVAKPLAILKHMEKVHSKFIFTNCNSLEQAAKNSITTYAQRKSQLDARRCYKEGHGSEALFITSFPGSEVPSWFTHRMIGSTLNVKFPPHWCDNRLSTIVLCAVVAFQDEISSFSVECTCEFENELGTCTRFTCILGGGWIEPRKIDSDHVFIGYTSCSNITNHVEGSQGHQRCVPTAASIKFKVIDGSGEIMNCGLSLVYEEPNHVVIEGDSNGTSSGRDLSVVESAISSATRFLSVVLRYLWLGVLFFSVFGFARFYFH